MAAPAESARPGIAPPSGLASGAGGVAGGGASSGPGGKATGLIELRAVCSNQVKKGALKVIDNVVAWPVDPTKPFNHDVNFGKFTTSLNIFSPCELCHYYEGRIGEVIDLSKTPDELGYRPRMTVYVRVKKAKMDTGASTGELLGVRLSGDEEKLLRRMKNHVLPNLGPDDACPLCARTETQAVGVEAGGALAGGVVRSVTSASAGAASAAKTSGIAEIGIQCGSASRLDEDFMAVRFGQTARLQEQPTNTMTGQGPPRSFASALGDGGGSPQGRQSAAAGAGGGQPAAGTGGGFIDIDGAVVNFKAELDQVSKEKEQLVLELREMTKAKTELERWRASHRCEVSDQVARLREDYEGVQSALRELVRGREEVFAALQARRSVGLGLQDTPRPYAPLKQGAPQLEPFTPQARQLLSKALGQRSASAADGSDASGGDASAHRASRALGEVDLSKRPSGGTARSASDQADPNQPNMANDRTPGQCMLRVTSTTGDSFYVRRRIGSEVRGGRHFLYLLSLDGTLTDEIFVSDLQAAGVEGPYGFRLTTTRNEFFLYLNPGERQRWVHWVYALAPFLAANAGDAAAAPIPPNF